VRRFVQELKSQGLDAEIAWTPAERPSLVAAAGRDPRCHCLVAVGGDGTVSALLNERPGVPITILPAGTENLVAQHFGLKRNPRWLARSIVTGVPVVTDLGTACGRRFALMVGFGFDGDVVTRHHSSRVTASGRIKPTHRAAYVEPILRASFCYRFPSISVTIDDHETSEVLTGTTVFVFNLPRYALGLPFAPHARHDDGLLDLVVFRDPGPFQALYYLWRVFCRTHLDHPGVFHRRVRRVTVQSNESVPVQLDGDPGGFLRMDESNDEPPNQPAAPSPGGWVLEALPGAVEFLVPTKWAARNGLVPLATSRALG
jgi:diacylglycerol kinase family enzyme